MTTEKLQGRIQKNKRKQGNNVRLTVFDIGGSSVKHALWDGEHLLRKSAFPTPKTWEAMKAEKKVKESHGQHGE